MENVADAQEHSLTPYAGRPENEWLAVTQALLALHPLTSAAVVAAVQAAWTSIFRSKVGDLTIGADIRPTPQVLGNFLHELIPVELAKIAPGWRRGTGAEKDAEYDPDQYFSAEIKTSSHPRDIFGNRSYAQPAAPGTRSKSGYYVAANFQSWALAGDNLPEITRIRMGWLDHTDWVPQASPTGQQAHLTAGANAWKLIDLL
jgi:ScaI restriction endonuclease